MASVSSDVHATDITATPEWTALAEHHAAVSGRHLRELFADDPERATALTAAGADLVALGRPFLATPDLVERLRLGAPLNPVREQHLMYTGAATGYTDYPTMDLAPRR